MKVIRRGVFETNSSASHTISIVKNFSHKEMRYSGYDDYSQYNSPIRKLVFVFAYIERLKQENNLELTNSEVLTLKSILINAYKQKTNKDITEKDINYLIFDYFRDIDTVGIDVTNKEFFSIFKTGVSQEEVSEVINKYFNSKCYIVDVENE